MYFLNGFLFVFLFLFFPLDGFAKVYKWVDKDGKIHLMSQPPTEETTRVKEYGKDGIRNEPEDEKSDETNDIAKIRESLKSTAKTEKNLGHLKKANRILSIEHNIAKNISNRRIAYVINIKLNEGKFAESILLSLGYEMPRRDDKEAYRQYNAIVENCEKKWDENFEMISFCIKEQIKTRFSVLSSKNDRIRKDCEKKWGDNFRMVSHCIKEQNKAKLEVLSSKNDRIRKDCEKKWGDNFRMVSHCIKKKHSK